MVTRHQSLKCQAENRLDIRVMLLAGSPGSFALTWMQEAVQGPPVEDAEEGEAWIAIAHTLLNKSKVSFSPTFICKMRGLG